MFHFSKIAYYVAPIGPVADMFVFSDARSKKSFTEQLANEKDFSLVIYSLKAVYDSKKERWEAVILSQSGDRLYGGELFMTATDAIIQTLKVLKRDTVINILVAEEEIKSSSKKQD